MVGSSASSQSATGARGFASCYVDVRLVSFPPSGVRNDLASNQDPSPTTGSFRLLLACIHRSCGEIIRAWLRHLPQRFLQFGQSVDFRYSTLQRSHRGWDVFEKMLMTFDKA